MSQFCLKSLRGMDNRDAYKRRRIIGQQYEQPEMSSSTWTSSTTVTFTEAQQPREVLRNLNQQRSDVASCDVIVRSSSSVTSSVYAHRCILAASSDYFKALFRHDLTDAKVIETVIEGSSHDVIESVVTYMYTGVIEISDDTVEEIVRLADYLELPKILELCEIFMMKILNESNCLKFKVLSEVYRLGTLSNSVQNYILPRMSTLVRRSDTVYCPVDVLRQLLSHNQTNYAREADVLKLIQGAITSRADMDEMEREKARDLLDCVEFEYLPPEVIERQVLSNADTLDWLSGRPELLERVRGMDGRNQSQGRDVVDGILCRGRALRTTGDDPQVMLYLVKDDAWRVLRQPRNEQGSGLWPGLEAMVTLDGFLYALSSRIEDVNRNMQPAKATKYFNRLNLQTGVWFVLPSPGLVTGETKLISAVPDLLFAIDLMGRVERYMTDESRWMDCCCTGFPGSANNTTCFLPMSNDGELYVVRTFTSSYSNFPQCYLSIYRLDSVPSGSDSGGHSWNELSQVEMADYFDMDEYVKFFFCSMAPGLISLKDEMGHTRAQFDTTEAKWTTFPMRVPRPGFIRYVNGSAECSSRVYIVALSARSGNIFVMYDTARGRFKMTHAPPYAVSDILCHVTLQSTSVELMCRED